MIKLLKKELPIILDDTKESFIKLICETIRAKAVVVRRVHDNSGNLTPGELTRKARQIHVLIEIVQLHRG